MPRLRLKFIDESGYAQQIEADGDVFTVGRHSACDLTVADSRLSREHIRIERSGDSFYVEDRGSSNGTTLNGSPLFEPEKLSNGDVLDLGGGLILTAEIESEAEPIFASTPTVAPETPAIAAPVGAFAPAATVQEGDSGIPTSIFILAPILGLLMLVIAGGLIYFFSSGNTIASGDDGDDVVYTNDDDDTKPTPRDKDDNKKPSPTPSGNSSGGNNGIPPETNSSPVNLGETGKVEQNAAAFLRLIAQNDSREFLTTEQAKRVNTKVKQLSRNSALVDNIKSARNSAAQIRSLAAAKNLKPQFLAIAAIAKLGSSRGDVLQTAQSIAEVYDKLATQIGNELADDSLLMVAAYNQGAAGDFMKMRNMLQNLSNQSPESARAIRTIWFLEKNGKITSAEFENALNFLATGTITQNPKDFGVNAEALVL